MGDRESNRTFREPPIVRVFPRYELTVCTMNVQGMGYDRSQGAIWFKLKRVGFLRGERSVCWH